MCVGVSKTFTTKGLKKMKERYVIMAWYDYPQIGDASFYYDKLLNTYKCSTYKNWDTW